MASDHHGSGDRQFKFVLIGDGATGKTSISQRFTQDAFDKQYRQTAGVDFFLKRVALPGAFNVTVQLWDVGGQALDGQMLDKYLYGANVVMFIYDITCLSSFESLNKWIEVVHNIFREDPILPHYALVGNKIDLEHMRTVRSDKHLKFAQDNGMSAHGVSAKTGESVNLCFQKTAGELLGIRLTRSEQENAQPVVKAEIVQNPVIQPGNHAIVPLNTTKTSACTIQ